MSRKGLVIYSVVLLTLVLVGAIYSRHGFLDLRRLQGQIQKTRAEIAAIEVDNQQLKRQVDLFEKPTEDLMERQVRDFLGWVKPNEVVYLEKSHVTPR